MFDNVLYEVTLATSEVTCPTDQVTQASSEVTCPKEPLQPRRLPGRNGYATSEVTEVIINREVTISMRLNLRSSKLGRAGQERPEQPGAAQSSPEQIGIWAMRMRESN